MIIDKIRSDNIHIGDIFIGNMNNKKIKIIDLVENTVVYICENGMKFSYGLKAFCKCDLRKEGK